MNFLFLTDEFYPTFGANSLVVRAVCRELVQLGHKVYVMPAGYDSTLPCREDFEGITVVRELPADTKQTMLDALRHIRLIKAAKILAMILGSRLLGPHSLWHKRKIAARDYLEQFIKENDIHTVVSINCSVELSFPLLCLRQKGRLPCKWFFYMLDPFASHEYYLSHAPEAKLRKLQHSIMTHCDRVLATELIYKDTALWETKAVLEKFRITEFPKIEKPENKPCEEDVALDPAFVHVVCTGSRNETVRNSQYTLAMCKQVSDLPVRFHFMGYGWTEDEQVRKDANCLFYPPHSPQVAKNLQLNGDILLNIGNTVTNQLPSKVLEYISTGKPIINFYKTEECPAKALLQKTDALHISEAEDMKAQLEKFRIFLTQAHTPMPFEAVEEAYRVYTPKEVIKNFLN